MMTAVIVIERTTFRLKYITLDVKEYTTSGVNPAHFTGNVTFKLR